MIKKCYNGIWDVILLEGKSPWDGLSVEHSISGIKDQKLWMNDFSVTSLRGDGALTKAGGGAWRWRTLDIGPPTAGCTLHTLSPLLPGCT